MDYHTSFFALKAGAVAFALAALGSGPAAASKISTYNSWDGSESIAAFGCPNTTTYGQVITIPAGVTSLSKFTFSWKRIDNDGPMKVRGEVYAWDGSKASGSALYESKKRTINYGDFLFHKETFKPNGVPVTPGAQYVLFASIDKDFEACVNNYVLSWGSVADTAYSGGTFVYQNNGGDESQWTITPWSTFGIDLAFKVTLSP